MGILNVTPDSFFDGGKYNEEDTIKERIDQILSEGGQIVDVGAVSTRPGADMLSEEEEMKRLTPALTILKNEYPDVIVSLDTFRASVARWAVQEYGVSIINDISGGTLDDKMFETIAELKVPYIMMHIKGTPETMQKDPHYDDLQKEVFAFFHERVEKLRAMGVADIIIDPGFGFAKNLEHNYELLNKLEDFKIFQLPLLVGVSRKSMVTRLLDVSSNEALNGSTALHAISLMKGADILRVHDVKEAVEVVRVVGKLKEV